MRHEFMFRLPNEGSLIDLNELRNRMDLVLSNKVRGDLSFMDKRMIEIYDQRISKTTTMYHAWKSSAHSKKNPTRGLIGKMSPRMILRKFE